jgi:hypothetical protein
MRQRICHWATMSIIYQLTMISIDEGLSNLPPPTAQPRTVLDENLANLLKTMHPSHITQIMKHYSESNISSIPFLLQNCREENKALYDNTTAAEYHCLLCASLLAFAKALSDLWTAVDQKSDTTTIRNAVRAYAAFLNTMVCSTAFAQHTQFLAEG